MAVLTAGRAVADSPDPLRPVLRHVDSFLRREESGGVTLDPRRLCDPPEQIRLSVVPQLLGYCELYRVSWREEVGLDLIQRADFLIQGMDAFRAGDAADGMLGYALLRAFELTGDPRYREAARPIVESCLGLDLSQLRLNRGLMAALVLAQHYRLTGDMAALAKATDIVWLAAREQHADGSFAHVCDASHDVHYTAWMAMELHLLGRLLTDPVIARVLTRAHAFLKERVGEDGITSYEELIAADRTLYYYSLPTCPGDYDTRGWTNELGYLALLFDRSQDSRYQAVMGRLVDVEDQGGFPDKLGYWPALEDPFYAWAGASRSIIRTSLIFWSLACIHADRIGSIAKDPVVAEAERVWGSAEPSAPSAGQEAAPPSSPAVAAALGPLAPNPAHGATWIPLRLRDPAAAIRLVIHDPAGRRVRTLLDGPAPAGSRRVRWDGRDEGGGQAPPGMYFVRFEVKGQVAATARLVLVP